MKKNIKKNFKAIYTKNFYTTNFFKFQIFFN